MDTNTVFNDTIIGSYCLYKEKNYLITSKSGETIKIISMPSPVQLQVKVSSVVITNHRPATLVGFRGDMYIRTGKGLIFSSATGKLMKWPENHGTRNAIMAA